MILGFGAFFFPRLLQTQWRGLQASQKIDATNPLSPGDPGYQDWPGAETAFFAPWFGVFSKENQENQVLVFFSGFFQRKPSLGSPESAKKRIRFGDFT